MEITMKLLLAEDTHDLNRAISAVLTHEGYSVDSVYDGMKAYESIKENSYDGIILDIMMPKMNGLEVLTEIRKNRITTPVLLLTAKAEIDDRVNGLDAGADDYLTKPFSVDELLARLRATIRRLNQAPQENADQTVFVNGQLRIDYAAGCAYLNGEELHLTPIEYRLLCLLAKNCGKVLTHNYITRQVWGTSWENNVASLRVFMATLRKKVGPDPAGPSLIQTHVGIGYRMVRMEN